MIQQKKLKQHIKENIENIIESSTMLITESGELLKGQDKSIQINTMKLIGRRKQHNSKGMITLYSSL